MPYKNDKEIVPLDTDTICGALYYGYTSKREAAKDMKAISGEPVDMSTLTHIYAVKLTLNGEDFYRWDVKCNHCGKPTGVPSILENN